MAYGGCFSGSAGTERRVGRDEERGGDARRATG